MSNPPRHFMVSGSIAVPLAVMVWGLAVCGCLRTAAGQTRPAALGPDITGSVELVPDARGRIKSYVEFWTGELANPKATAEGVEAARSELLRPVTGINLAISPAFRFEYASVVTPALRTAINGENTHAAVNALIVLSQLGSNSALSEALIVADKRTTSRWQVRQHAAIAAKSLLVAEGVDSAKIVSGAERLRDLAKDEDNPMVLRRMFEAMSAADSPRIRTDETRERRAVRAALLDAWIAVVDRIVRSAGEKPDHLVEAALAGQTLLRQKYLNISMDERPAMGMRMAPSVAQLLGVAERDWDAAQKDDQNKRLYSLLVTQSEEILNVIDEKVRGAGKGPKTQLKNAWISGNKDQFRKDLKMWIDPISAPPYRTGG